MDYLPQGITGSNRVKTRRRSFIIVFLAIIGALAIVSKIGRVLFGDIASINGNIGHVKIEGKIVDSSDSLNALKSFREKDSIKAVLVRIDSPGGAIAPSQEIFFAIQETAKKKPVVVSMGSVAASGGYYIASGASKIVANPGTVTGSIGVIMQHFVFDKIARKYLIDWEILKAGAVKDMGSNFRQLTVKERELMQAILDDMHEQFINHIAEGRHLPREEVTVLATGEIFTGRKALELKLVDELGSQEKALELAAKLGGVKDEPKLAPYVKEQSFTDQLLDRLSTQVGHSMAYPLQLLGRQIPAVMLPGRPALPEATLHSTSDR